MDGMNKEKWQAMSRKEKYDHIMYYYKTYIIIGLIALLVIGNLLYFTITHVEPDLSVLMINNVYQEELDQSIFDEFAKTYGYDNSKGKMAIYNNFFILTEEEGANGDMITTSHQNLSALQAWLQVGQDDIIIGSGHFVENGLIDGEAFLDLREVFSPQQMEQFAEYIVYGQPADLDEEFEDIMGETTEPYPCALRLVDNGWISGTKCYKECYVAIPINSHSREIAADFLLYLLSKQP